MQSTKNVFISHSPSLPPVLAMPRFRQFLLTKYVPQSHNSSAFELKFIRQLIYFLIRLLHWLEETGKTVLPCRRAWKAVCEKFCKAQFTFLGGSPLLGRCWGTLSIGRRSPHFPQQRGDEVCKTTYSLLSLEWVEVCQQICKCLFLILDRSPIHKKCKLNVTELIFGATSANRDCVKALPLV